jgi:hypothetical protein
MTELENITKETCKDAQSQTPKTMHNATQTQMQNSARERTEGNTRNDTSEIFHVDELEWEALGHLKHRLDINDSLGC